MGWEVIIHTFFEMYDTIKLYHWQTHRHARHLATDRLLTAILPLIDQFVETYIGRYQRPKFAEGKISLTVPELTDDRAVVWLNHYIDFLKKEIPHYVETTDSDLLNIRDEILGALNQTLYLFTLK